METVVVLEQKIKRERTLSQHKEILGFFLQEILEKKGQEDPLVQIVQELCTDDEPTRKNAFRRIVKLLKKDPATGAVDGNIEYVFGYCLLWGLGTNESNIKLGTKCLESSHDKKIGFATLELANFYSQHDSIFRAEQYYYKAVNAFNEYSLGMKKTFVYFQEKNQYFRKNRTLHDAASNGLLEVIVDLVANGASLDRQDREGNTPLTKAIQNEHSACAEFLMEANADVNLRQKGGDTLLHTCIKIPEMHHLIPLLLEKGGQELLETPDKDGNTPLLFALEHKEIDAALMLLNAKANVKAKNKDLENALHVAIENDCIRALPDLLRRGAPTNSKNGPFSLFNQGRNLGGLTPFRAAFKEASLYHDLTAAARILLETNPLLYPPQVDEHYKESLEDALKDGRVAGTHDLFEKYSETARRNLCSTLVTKSRWSQSMGDLLTLIEAGATFDTIKSSSQSSLYGAARCGNTGRLPILLHYGAELDQPVVEDGKTALDVAAAEAVTPKSVEFIKLLRIIDFVRPLFNLEILQLLSNISELMYFRNIPGDALLEDSKKVIECVTEVVNSATPELFKKYKTEITLAAENTQFTEDNIKKTIINALIKCLSEYFLARRAPAELLTQTWREKYTVQKALQQKDEFFPSCLPDDIILLICSYFGLPSGQAFSDKNELFNQKAVTAYAEDLLEQRVLFVDQMMAARYTKMLKIIQEVNEKDNSKFNDVITELLGFVHDFKHFGSPDFLKDKDGLLQTAFLNKKPFVAIILIHQGFFWGNLNVIDKSGLTAFQVLNRISPELLFNETLKDLVYQIMSKEQPLLLEQVDGVEHKKDSGNNIYDEVDDKDGEYELEAAGLLPGLGLDPKLKQDPKGFNPYYTLQQLKDRKPWGWGSRDADDPQDNNGKRSDCVIS